jgi:integrase
MSIHKIVQTSAQPPASYLAFVHEMRSAAVLRGLAWDIELEENGRALPETDWDLRKLNRSHQVHLPGSCGFSIDRDLRTRALESGWHEARLPEGRVLPPDAQDFVKALIVDRCIRGRTADNAQVIALAARRLLSLTNQPPWELTAEHFEAVLLLKDWSEKAQRDFSTVGKLLDEHLLSHHCPVRPTLAKREQPTLLTSLQQRKGADKLPELPALLELTRIIFNERPQTFSDAVRFGILKLAMFTGLRIEEVVSIPMDCLVWDEHLDMVTGASAGAVGGVARSLRLRYFAEKHNDGAPDVLVEAYQHVPALFERAVAATVEEMVELVGPAREVLRRQHQNPESYPNSDCRTFRTNNGTTVSTGDRLFLSMGLRELPLTLPLSPDTAVKTPNLPPLYAALGRTKYNGMLSFFKKYGKDDDARTMSLKPHSLRHLLNTELFRQNVPDTIITHHFGRKTVAQSYEYDHRNLSEKLRFVQLPPAASSMMPAGSAQELVAKMVVSGLALHSHLGQSFKRIQQEQGDEAAFSYLVANADGFHVTPYGYCTNSFSVNPCARHLKCFDQCKHFTASGLTEHRVTLEELRAKLVAMRDSADSKPVTTVGRKNQIAHAERLIAGVSAAIDAAPRQTVFPDGIDFSTPQKDLFA